MLLGKVIISVLLGLALHLEGFTPEELLCIRRCTQEHSGKEHRESIKVEMTMSTNRGVDKYSIFIKWNNT